MAKTLARLTVVLVVASGLVSSTVLEAGKKKVRPGAPYSSASRLFNVTAPQACSPFSMTYAVTEETKKGREWYEEAALYVSDMGELYRVGARGLTPEMRQAVGQPEGQLSPIQLAWLGLKIHVGSREKETGTWKPAGDPESVETKHGLAVLSVNQVEGGRFLVTATSQGGKLVARPSPPASVVVLLVQNPESLLYVTGQADAADLEGVQQAPECVRRQVLSMFDSLTFAELPPTPR